MANVIHFCLMSTTLSIRLTDDLAEWVEEQSRVTGRSQGSLVKDALKRARQSEAKPFMKLAGCLEGPADLSLRKGFAKE